MPKKGYKRTEANRLKISEGTKIGMLHSIKWNSAKKEGTVGKRGKDIAKRKIRKAVIPTVETRKKMSESRIKYFKENPMAKKIISEQKKKLWIESPEKHPNRVLARNKHISKKQLILFNAIKGKYSDAKLEFPIKTKEGMKFADIAVPSLKIDFEYDGGYWHKDKKRDSDRDLSLFKQGWKVVRVNEQNLKDYIL